jgi:hypothetical protein
MEGQIMLTLALASPVILLPALFVWYMNFGGIYSALKKAWGKRTRQSSLTEEIKIDEK